MRAVKLSLAAFFGALGLIIAAAAIVSAATSRTNKVSTFVNMFEEWGLTPGLILLSAAAILFFLPQKSTP